MFPLLVMFRSPWQTLFPLSHLKSISLKLTLATPDSPAVGPLWVPAPDQGRAQGKSGRKCTQHPLENMLRPPTEATISQGPLSEKQANQRPRARAKVSLWLGFSYWERQKAHLVGEPVQGRFIASWLAAQGRNQGSLGHLRPNKPQVWVLPSRRLSPAHYFPQPSCSHAAHLHLL